MFNHTAGLLLQTALLLVNTDPKPQTVPNTNTLYQAMKGEEKDAKCYGELGCYPINYPWIDHSRPVAHYPDPPSKIKPGYCLYTRSNINDCQKLNYNDSESIYRSFLLPNHKIYFISHGFLEDGFKSWIEVMKNKLLNRTDCNVVAIDWGGGSSPPYTQAAANIRLVGTVTAHLIYTLHRDVGFNPKLVHIIGHSLGAHLAGYAGNILQTKFGLKIGRITGMDPAEPHFSETDPVVRLDPSDAIFVDIIHTDAAPFIKGGLGMDEPIGHLDFFPNGGDDQPGCNHGMMNYIKAEDGSFIKGVRRFLGCDHVRSHEYFMESIDSECQFLAIECDTYENFIAGKCFGCRNELNPDGFLCSQMGLKSVKTVQRDGALVGNLYPTANRSMVKLFTITAKQSPYCLSLYRVTFVISNSVESIEHGGEVGIFEIQIIGIKGRTTSVELFKEQHFKPNSTHVQVIGGAQVGRVTGAKIIWSHRTTFNILTWRFKRPYIYLSHVYIENLEEEFGETLCPEAGQILSHKKVDARPCEPKPDPISSSENNT